MKIIDGLKLESKRMPIDIPDCGRDDLAQFFKDMGYKVGVEIGTSKGVFAKNLAQVGLKLYCVDPWLDYPDYSRGDAKWQKDLNGQYERTKALLAPYDCTLIRKTSMEALKDFADESLDFVYIDGNHEFQYIANDLAEWTKKVRKGGVISGHDYFFSNPHGFDRINVKEVVNAFTYARRINPWYVIGRKEKVEGEVRDNFRSFFWIKQ